MKEVCLALNTRNWLPKEDESVEDAKNRTIHDLASAAIEQREAPLEERINTYSYILGEKMQLFEKETGNRPVLRWAKESDQLENHAFLLMEHWAKEGFSKNLAWFSPPDEKHGYTETRLVVSEREKDGNETIIVCRAFCLPHSEEECVSIAKEIAETSDHNIVGINSGDTLRAFPVFFNPPKNLTWYEYLEGKIIEPNIWKKVKDGGDYKSKDEALKLSEPIVDKYFDLIIAAKNAYDYVLAGAFMEREWVNSNIIFQANGSCGVSNQAALETFKRKRGIFNTVFDKAAVPSNEKFFDCPKCNKAIPSGFGITVCPHCGARKEDYGKCV
jgi:hypothetical protein